MDDSATHKSVVVPVDRDRKIQTALRTHQIARFGTMLSEKKKIHLIVAAE